jgi:hypothetical protein
MYRLSNKKIEENARVLYEAGGTPLLFDWVREYNESNREYKIPYEKCEACDCMTPSLEHDCLICGQETKSDKPVFYQAVLKKVKGNIFNHVYPHIENADKEFTLAERLGSENGSCSECGGNEWMLLPKESVAVSEGGKPYIECLKCGSVQHL